MKKTNKINMSRANIEKYMILTGLLWTAFIVAILSLSISHQQSETLEIAQNHAQASFEKDLVYRRWAAEHGGVYVPVTQDTPPNPHLSHLKERDITTPSGRQLTLVNPAYMTRQVHELGAEQYGLRGHITSLNPIRPENAPDLWERGVLEGFEKSPVEVTSLEKIDGHAYMRLMKPMVMEQGCLKCHASQGYNIGDIRGGISVSIPMQPLWAIGNAHMKKAALGYGGVWLSGLIGIGIAAKLIKNRITQYNQVQDKLKKLLHDKEERVKELKCLYSVAESIQMRNTLEEIFQDVAELIPSGWHCPENTRGRVIYNGKEYVSEPFEETGPKLSSDIIVNGKLRGSVEAYCLEECPMLDEGPFVKEERDLINGIARSLGETIEHKQAELKFQTLYESSGDAVMLLDENGFFDCNNATVRIFKCKDKMEFCSKHPADLSPVAQPCGTDSIALANQQIATAIEKGRCHFEWIHQTVDGTEFPADVLLTAMELDGNKVLQAVVRDTTERKKAEAEAIKARQNFKTILSKSPFGVVVIGRDRKIRWANEYTCALAGVEDTDALSGKGCDGYLCTAQQNECPILDKGQSVDNSERILRRYDGREIPILKTIAEIELNGEPVLLETFIDLTERKQAEKKTSQFAQILEASLNEIYIFDAETFKFLQVNKGARDNLGYTLQECRELTPLDIKPNITSADFAELIEPLRTGDKEIIDFETVHQRKDGSLYDAELHIQLSDTGSDPVYIAIVLDITHRKKMETEKQQLQIQLRQTQKMEAIGTLAGGIAHDFNNMLGALIGYADLAKDDIPEGTIAHQNQEEVLIAANRAKELVKQILTFGRRDDTQLVPVQINAIVTEALKLLRSSLPTTIEIKQEIDCNCVIVADETQIHQVLMNLVTNAAHAMGQQSGLVEVTLSEINSESDGASHDGNPPQGSYVKLSVRDTGCGMSKEVLERIFDPFYTTKEVGKGTGMGLSVVHGIVENHSGVIAVESEPGKGTTFELFFPCVEDREIMTSEESEVALGKGERILFVDDEKSLVNMATQMLTRMGYEVTGQTDSIEALEAFRADPARFSLVITDQTMPNLAGMDLAKELMDIRPDIPIILCTGFSENVNSEDAKAVGIKELVMKPVNREEISQIIREILDVNFRPFSRC